MADYDNTNKGAAFPPFATQQMILQGKVNIDGTDTNVVLVKDETKSGKTIISVYQKVGVLFANDKGKEGQPDYTGSVELRYVASEKRLAAWKKMGNEKPFLSLSVSDKTENSQGSMAQPKDTLVDDKIPF
jgi:hypothetical protein